VFVDNVDEHQTATVISYNQSTVAVNASRWHLLELHTRCRSSCTQCTVILTTKVQRNASFVLLSFSSR